jgi:hypothetical protein
MGLSLATFRHAFGRKGADLSQTHVPRGLRQRFRKMKLPLYTGVVPGHDRTPGGAGQGDLKALEPGRRMILTGSRVLQTHGDADWTLPIGYTHPDRVVVR